MDWIDGSVDNKLRASDKDDWYLQDDKVSDVLWEEIETDVELKRSLILPGTSEGSSVGKQGFERSQMILFIQG